MNLCPQIRCLCSKICPDTRSVFIFVSMDQIKQILFQKFPILMSKLGLLNGYKYCIHAHGWIYRFGELKLSFRSPMFTKWGLRSGNSGQIGSADV